MDYKSPEPTKKGSATMPSTQVPVPGTFFYESEAAKASQETWSSCSNTQTAMQYLCLPVPACHYHGNSDTSGNSLPSRPHLNKEYCTIKLVIKKTIIKWIRMKIVRIRLQKIRFLWIFFSFLQNIHQSFLTQQTLTNYHEKCILSLWLTDDIFEVPVSMLIF